MSTDIVGIVISTREAVSDLKISIGDSDSPLTNAECSVGVQIEANATSAQVRRGTILETSFTALCHLLAPRSLPRVPVLLQAGLNATNVLHTSYMHDSCSMCHCTVRCATARGGT